MRYRVLASLLVIIGLLFPSLALSGELAEQVRSRITAAGPTELVKVWIKLPTLEEASILKTAGQNRAATRIGRYHATAGRLIESHAEAQKPVLTRLHQLRARRLVDNIKPHWLVNVVEVEIAAGELPLLAERGDIEIIHMAPEIRLIAPEVVEESVTAGAGAVVENLIFINADLAWTAGYTGRDRVICSFDTGVDGDHPILSGSWKGNDGDYSAAWFYPLDDGDGRPHAISDCGYTTCNTIHGTHVMGTIVGRDAASGDIYGVAPDARWISAAVIDLAGSSIIDAFEWAANPDGDLNTVGDVPDVINHSWGVIDIACENIFFNLIDNTEALGIVNIFACGNEGPGEQTIRNPANRALDSLDCFSVGNADGMVSPPQIYLKSSRGPSDCNGAIKPNVTAPGVYVRSAVPGGGYASMTGSSMAAPHVSGLVALLREKNPNATVDEIKNAILTTTQTFALSLPDNDFGWGIIDCLAALNALSSVNTEPNVRVHAFDHGMIAPGVTVSGTLSLQNVGAGVSDVQASLLNLSPELTVLDGVAYFGTIDEGEVVQSADVIRVAVSGDAAEGAVLALDIEITGSGGYYETARLYFQVEPTPARSFVTHSVGRIEFSLANYGTFGLAENSFFPAGGAGFTFDGGFNELYEGGLIVGTDPNHISDGLRNAAGEPDGDFGVLSGGGMTIREPGNVATQQTRVAFSDDRAEYPLGLDIVQESYAWSTYPDDDFIILRYVVTNTNSYGLFGVLLGLYLDWDVVEYLRNAGGCQTGEGYVWIAYNDPSSGDLRDFRGATVVDGPEATMLTQRGEYVYYPGSLNPEGDGFTEQEKASALAAGIVNADVYKGGSLDLFQLVAAGPLSLAPGGTDTVAFAILAGDSLAEISDAAVRAMDAYEALGEPSAITITEDLPDPIGLGETGPVSVSVLSESDSVVLCYRQGGKSTYDRQIMTGSGQSYAGTVPGSSVTLRGVDYYVVAYSGGDSVTSPPIGGLSELIPFRARAAFADIAGPALADGNYRMVSFPFEIIPNDLSAVLEDDLGPPDRSVWRLGRWNQVRATYDEYEQVGPLEPGRGYWLVVSGDKTIDAGGRSTVPDVIVGGEEFWSLPLQPGWNQIANPFAFRVGWDDCVRDDDLEPVLHEYTGTGYELASALEPFGGYWLRNTAGGVRYLYIPFKEEQTPAASPIRAYRDCLWRISLRLETAGLHDTSNFCGAHGLASSGSDPFDLGEPPVMGSYVSLSFVEESDPGTRRLLAGDFREAERERWEFQLLIRGNSGESARLSIGETFGLRDSMTLRISSESGSLDHDLRESGEVLLPEPLSEAGMKLKLTVGCMDCGGHNQGSNIPLSPSLHPNYPNPFNPSTTISFDLPRGSKYTLTIYNVIGQKVDEFTGHARAGAVEIDWDATGKASGIYLYKLTSSGFTATRKMLLLK